MNPDAQNFRFFWVTGRRTFSAVLARQTGALEASVASTAAQMSPVSGTGSQPRGKGLQPIKLRSCWFWGGWAQLVRSTRTLDMQGRRQNCAWECSWKYRWFQHLKTSCSVFSVCFAAPWAWGAPALQRAITESPTPLRKASATVCTCTCFWMFLVCIRAPIHTTEADENTQT